MLPILFYWSIVLLFTLGIGKKISERLGNKENDLLFDFLNGLFYYLIISWIASYFTGVSSNVMFMFIIISGIFSTLSFFFYSANQEIKLFSNKKLSLFLVFFILIIAFNSSLTPFLQDNETYYVQTIKWAAQYGFVPGLINLHPFLGQFSGWHILQAAMFSFGNRFFNDLNGLLFIFYVIFVWKKLNSFLNNAENKLDAFVGLQFIFFPFLLFFVNAPSPDLPLIVMAQLIFYLFLKNYQQTSEASIKQMILLAFFSVLIKITALPLLIFPLILVIKKASKTLAVYFLIYAIIAFGLWISKNIIITGYPFYPFSWASGWVNEIWKYPPELMRFMNDLGRKESYALHLDTNFFKDFLSWLLKDKLHSLLHIFWVLLLLIFPLINWKIKTNKPLKIIYLVAVLYFMVLLFFNPNIRFFIYFVPFLSAIIFYYFLPKYLIKYSMIFVAFFMLIINFYIMKESNRTSLVSILFYHPVSKYEDDFKQDKIENLSYYYPNHPKIFWETGNAPLPAVSNNQLEYFRKFKKIYPQKIKNDMKFGFYSKKIYKKE